MHSVFIDGAAGTTGLRIHQRLQARDDIRLLTLPEESRKDLQARAEAVREADVTFLCLPDAAAREIVALADKKDRIIDASTAHRTAPGWSYGFPELHGGREAIRQSTRVANPGCHASGFLALAAPLVRGGLADASFPFSCWSITGYSGGGKGMIADYTAPDRPASYAVPRQYGLSQQHKHLPEMQAAAGLAVPPMFSPILGDYECGMLVSVPVPACALTGRRRSVQEIADYFAEYYADEPLIHVRAAGEQPEDGTLAADAMAGRDAMEIFILGSATQLLLAARFDNLGKGASGAAIQNMNLMLGCPEIKGLVL